MPLLARSPKPRIILGLMTFGPDVSPGFTLCNIDYSKDWQDQESAGARITSLPEYKKCLDYLQSQGYNEVDTARTYVGGQQEAFTREAHWKDRGLTIATKLYPQPGRVSHKPDVLTQNFEVSLKELGTDCVDIFYLHAADRSTPFTETLEAVDRLHKQWVPILLVRNGLILSNDRGKFVQLGLSNFTAFEVAEVVMTCKYNNWVRPTIYQG